MKDLIKFTNLIIFILIIVSSCSTHKKGTVACPDLKSQRVEKKLHLFNHGFFSFKPNRLSKAKKNVKPMKSGEKHIDMEKLYLSPISSIGHKTPFISVTQQFNTIIAMKHKKKTDEINITSEFKAHQAEADTNNNHKNNTNPYNQEIQTAGVSPDKHSGSDDDVTGKLKTKRKIAIITGVSLLLMAVLAGISIPALGSLGASIGLSGIFLLDLLVSLGIYQYHKNEQPGLAKASGLLRLLYTAILGGGIAYLFAGNVPMFNKIWGIGLIAFGVHLITLGILFNNEDGKKWVNIAIKSLLIIAGIGYIIQYAAILLVPNPAGFAALIESIFILPMISGEISYALWMLIKGGKKD